ncbi:MAG: cyclic nucleotide-binding domain-containing protein [Candidatus Firestonebacteria bacterium]
MNIIQIIKNKIFGEKSEVAKILEKIPIFGGLNELELKKIELITHERSYLSNEVVFHEKEPGAGMYIIKNGSIRLTKKRDLKEVEVAVLKEKEFFGELALLDEDPRSATATAIVKTEVLGFYRPDFLTLLQREPKLGSKVLLKLAQILAARLRHTTETSVKKGLNDDSKS